jgi:hypothetical protein
LLRAQCSILGLETHGNKEVLVLRLLEAKARPMLPGFVLVWPLQAHAVMREGTRQPGPVVFSTPELDAAIDPPVPSQELPPDSELEQMHAKIAALQAALNKAKATPPAAGGVTLTEATLTKFLHSAATAAATVAIEAAAANEARAGGAADPTPKLAPLAQLRKKAVDAVLGGVYFHLSALSVHPRLPLLPGEETPRQRVRGRGDLEPGCR